MKLLKIISLTALTLACGAILICLITDWNDSLFLELSLVFSLTANLINVLANRRNVETGNRPA